MKIMKIRGRDVEIEGEGFITIPYYKPNSDEIEGIARVPMLSKSQFPHSVFEYLQEKADENPKYKPTKDDLKQFFYVLFTEDFADA